VFDPAWDLSPHVHVPGIDDDIALSCFNETNIIERFFLEQERGDAIHDRIFDTSASACKQSRNDTVPVIIQ